MRRKFWPENLNVGDYSEDLDIDGRIILEWIIGSGLVSSGPE
jgi:hypothetical protein